jgi:hypothetical protein
MEISVIAMLQTAIAAGLVLCAGMWALYFWLKHTGQLNSEHHKEQPRRGKP